MRTLFVKLTVLLKKGLVPAALILFIMTTACGGGGGGGGEQPSETPDTTAPYIVSVLPSNTTNIPVNQSFTIRFNESMDEDTLNDSTIRIEDNNGNTISGTLQYSNGVAVLTPSSPLQYNATYILKVTTSVKDLSGNCITTEYNLTFTTSESPSAEIEVKKNTTIITSGSSGHDFGDVVVNNTSQVTFTIHNTGSLDLSVSNVVSSNSLFTVDSLPASTIAGGDLSSFTVTFRPTAVSSQSATIYIYNSDSDESTYAFTLTGHGIAAPAPEINIKKGITDIATGTTNAHDYGSVISGQTGSTVTFTIENTGSADLNLTGNPKVVSSSSEFTVDTQPDSPINLSGTTTFTVTFRPTSTGSKSATITIANNDANESSYAFTVTGTCVPAPAPEINIKQGETTLVNNSSCSFGGVTVNGTKSLIFTIENLGNADLNLTGNPKIKITGTDASMFSVIQEPSTPIIQGGNTSFIVQFVPSSSGTKFAAITIQNNDGDESNYKINLSGNGNNCVIVKDINSGSGSSSITKFLGKINNKVFFINDVLWKTDGTESGTSLVKNIYLPFNATVLNNKLFFPASTSQSGSCDLWTSDGTNTGTVVLSDFTTTGGGIHSNIYMAGSYVCFIAGDKSSNDELWYSNGVNTYEYEADGGYPIGYHDRSSNATIVSQVGNYVYFIASYDSPERLPNTEMFIFNNSNVSFCDINSGNGSSNPSYFSIVNNYLFFRAKLTNTSSAQLMIADGSSVYSYPEFAALAFINNLYWCQGGSSLYSATNVYASANLIKDIKTNNGTYYILEKFCALNSKTYFFASDTVNGTELWVTDNTTGGTYLVKHISSEYQTVTSGPFILNGRILFVANDGIHGSELWVSDGSETGTSILVDIKSGVNSSNINNAFVKNGLLYFTADDGIHGVEMWVSDGTFAGTNIVMDINPGSGSSEPGCFYDAGSIIYFKANDGIHGAELWKLEL